MRTLLERCWAPLKQKVSNLIQHHSGCRRRCWFWLHSWPQVATVLKYMWWTLLDAIPMCHQGVWSSGTDRKSSSNCLEKGRYHQDQDLPALPLVNTRAWKVLHHWTFCLAYTSLHCKLLWRCQQRYKIGQELSDFDEITNILSLQSHFHYQFSSILQAGVLLECTRRRSHLVIICNEALYRCWA